MRRWSLSSLCVRTGAILTVLLLFAGDIAFIANVTNFTLFVTFILINGAVIVLRYRSPGAVRAFRVPGTVGRMPVLPLAGIVSCFALLAAQEPAVLLFGLVLTAIGIVLLLAVKYLSGRHLTVPRQ